MIVWVLNKNGRKSLAAHTLLSSPMSPAFPEPHQHTGRPSGGGSGPTIPPWASALLLPAHWTDSSLRPRLSKGGWKEARDVVGPWRGWQTEVQTASPCPDAAPGAELCMGCRGLDAGEKQGCLPARNHAAEGPVSRTDSPLSAPERAGLGIPPFAPDRAACL